MKRTFRPALLSLTVAFSAIAPCIPSHGYELGTHEMLTREAYKASILADPVASPLIDLGVADQGTARFLSRDLGMSSEGVRWTDARGIVALGARLEDLPLLEGRFLNHFFDPQRQGRGLGGINIPSPRWILEDTAPVIAQFDSLSDALAPHLRALTEPTAALRDSSLVVLLERLGRSLHHVQDMAQPSHTRDDAHGPTDPYDIYESYTERFFSRATPPLPAYSSPPNLAQFDTARKFWTNEGRGIAEFSSYNFVSKSTSFTRSPSGSYSRDPDHNFPVATGTSIVPLADLGLSWLANPTATVTFIHTQVEDLYTGTSWTNDRASSYSIFTSDLNEAAQFADVRPNVLTFERNYSYLLPRAISYSAGLLNYYFRGVLDVEDMTSQGSAVTLTIRNASLPNYGFSGSPGATEPDFQLYYDTMNGQRQLVTLVNNDLGTGQLAAGATHEFTFNEPNDLDRTKEKPYVLVFNGIVGTELAVVAKAFGTGSGGFIVTPKYPTGDGITGSRTIRWNGSNWIRTAEVGLQGGGADWQGHDPVDVLSFDGVGRYFGARANGVYMNGHVLTGGPGPGSTLGASIRYVDGVRTLNIVKWSVGDRIDVYSRRFADRYTDEDMWTEENQMGWRLVYSGTGGAPFTGFFFNASGTEGQYITIDPANGGPRTRVKITLAGAGGSAVELPAVATVQRTDRTVVSTENDTDVTAGTCEAVSPHHGEPHSDPNDACRSTGLQGVYTATSTRTLTETYSDRTILCVDYRGDEEVLCELLPPDQAVVETRTIQIHRGVDRFNTSPLGSETCPAERHDADQTTQDTTTQSETRWLRVGDAVIPWTSTTGTQTHSLSAIGSFIPSTNFEISDSGSGNSQHRTTKLIHADARHNLAVYESRTDESAGSWQAGVSQSANYSRTEVVMQVGAQQSVLYESEETSAPTGVHQNHGGPPLPVDCLSYNDLTDTPTVSSVTDSAGGVNLFRSNMWSHGSYAVDRAGRIAGSLLILFQSPGGLPVTHGYRNFLTEGDLPGLFPGIPSPDGHGYEIKVIR